MTQCPKRLLDNGTVLSLVATCRHSREGFRTIRRKGPFDLVLKVGFAQEHEDQEDQHQKQFAEKVSHVDGDRCGQAGDFGPQFFHPVEAGQVVFGQVQV